MNLGFSFSTPSVQPVTAAAPITASQEVLNTAGTGVLQKTALIAAQLGTTVSFFTQINTNRYYVSRMALVIPSSRDDETLDQKRAKSIIRKLKSEKSEPSNDQRPQ